MRRAKQISLFAAILIVLGLSGLAFGPCVEHRDLDLGLGFYRVTITSVTGGSGGDGSPADPYDFPNGPITITFNASAHDKRGDLMADYGNDGTRPAVMVYPNQTLVPQSVLFVDGRATGAQVTASGAYGRVALLIADYDVLEVEPVQGFLRQVPQTNVVGSYASGVSQSIHFKAPSLRGIQINSDIQANGDTYVSNLNNNFVEVDCREDDPDGPWQDGHGHLVVTGTSVAGFYATDMADHGEGFNHMYVYTYSFPENIEVGDRIDWLIGTTSDFSGFTEMSFPDYRRAMDENEDPTPYRVQDLDALVQPLVITTAVCNEGSSSSTYMCGHSKKNWTLEANESALVRLENIRTPDLFVNCDFNNDQETVPEWLDSEHPEAMCTVACLQRDGGTVVAAKEIIYDPDNTQVFDDIAVEPCQNNSHCASNQCGGYTEEDMNDGLCRTMCPFEESIEGIRPNCIEIQIPNSVTCGELSTFNEWGQWAVSLDDGNSTQISVITRDNLVNFDPTSVENLGMSVSHLQGNLRQIRGARPRWVITVGARAEDSPAWMRQ